MATHEAHIDHGAHGAMTVLVDEVTANNQLDLPDPIYLAASNVTNNPGARPYARATGQPGDTRYRRGVELAIVLSPGFKTAPRRCRPTW